MNVRHAIRAIPTGVVVSLVLAFALCVAPAHATTIYTSEGFEGFALGSIDGQDSWGGGLGTIQDSVVLSGDQAFSIASPVANQFSSSSRTIVDTPTGCVRVSLDVRYELNEGLQKTFVFRQGGSFLTQFQRGGGGWSFGGITTPATEGVWYHVDLDLDFDARSITAWVDGIFAGTQGFSTTTTGALNLSLATRATGATYVDNLKVTQRSPAYSAGGFESFTAGSIDGQDGWGGGQGIIQTAVVRTGAQAFSIASPVANQFSSSSRVIDDAPTGCVRVSLDVQYALNEGLQKSISFFQGGGFLQQFQRAGGGFSFGGIVTNVTEGTWYRIDLDLDFESRLVTAWVDGVFAGAEGMFSTPDGPLSLSLATRATGETYVDNVKVTPLTGIYNAAGFEGFALGSIEGQDGWGGDQGTIQSSVVRNGSQAFSIASAVANEPNGSFRTVDDSPGGIVRVSADLRFAATEALQISLGFIQGGSFLQQFQRGTGVFNFGGLQTPALQDTWYHVDVDLNFETRTVTARVDGAFAGTESMFSTPEGTELLVQFFTRATEDFYVDNFTVKQLVDGPDSPVVVSVPSQGPSRSLFSMSPRPSVTSGSTTIHFARAFDREVNLRIYDLRGRLVRSLTVPSGAPSRRWDGRDRNGRSVASGVYALRIDLGSETVTARVAMVK